MELNIENQNNIKITFSCEEERQAWLSLSEEDKKEWQLTADYLKEEWPQIVTGDSINFWRVQGMNAMGA